MTLAPSSLAKGQACLDCRRRKIKCDGVRPICGPCYRAQRYEDCEFGSTLNSKTPSRMQRIENDIALVEHRIMDLQIHSSLPLQTLRRDHSGRNGVQTNSTQTQVLQIALETIVARAEEIGFFLHLPKFRSLCFGTAGSRERPPSALTDSICLWAAVISPSESLRKPENKFLARAVQASTTISASSHRLKILYGIQTEILLCQYFLHKGRLVEAQYHLSIAVSFAVVGKLAHIGSTGSQFTFRDSIERGEYIIGYWTVVALDGIWSSMLNFPSHFGSESILNADTPWPLEMDTYERNPPIFPPMNTVRAFMENVPNEKEPSRLSVLAKAAILLQKADCISREWQPNMSSRDSAAYFQRFSELNERIRTFRVNSPNTLAGYPPAFKPRVILAHSVAHVATLQLNRIFMANAQCRELALASCKSIVWTIHSADWKSMAHIDPIIGSIWSTTAGMLFEEITRIQTVPGAAAVVADLRNGYDEIVLSVSHFSKDSAFMQFQLTQLCGN
ncbi:hypothetical protein MIND_00996300 [Mycena indigotica]|uniref:Zn(2)-C6 fungal-type domain-containing protein n=1 Tax=Mycena indigotica TaxID=2126181 RepID=A0A8H6SA59_9AGAR|nr:uncharacterized protein MIND_00996300 [Mycena indigotica]KAF7294597.1 hypothetical protein MIND_00996300 [Mycena indigotica]